MKDISKQIYRKIIPASIRKIIWEQKNKILTKRDERIFKKKIKGSLYMNKAIIFYGAGQYAKSNLERWLSEGLIPTCFVDKDERKHHKYIKTSYGSYGNEIQFEILPLKEAIERYPEYQIIITIALEPYSAYQELLESGIPQERLHYTGPKWCPEIGNYFVIHGPGIQTCCSKQALCLPSKGNINDDLALYQQYCSQLSNSLRAGLFTSCTGCYMLHDGISEINMKIKEVNVSSGLPGGDHCNFKCSYCTYGEDINKYTYKDNVLEILLHISNIVQLEKIHYNCGEITVSPFRDEILSLWEKNIWKGEVLTNGSIYNEKIADLLQKNLITLQCSIDSGTKGTFARIKGADCFDKVINNLKKYSETNGSIYLKYIILEGINDNNADLDGFVAISKEINAKVVISRDNRISSAMTKSEYSAVLRLTEQCKLAGIPYSFVLDYVDKDLDRLRSDNLIQ